MTWWQKLFGGSVEKKPVKRLQDMDQNTGEIDSPEFLEYLKVKGIQYIHRRLWWQRVWTTHTPDCVYPNLKQVWEVEQFNVKNEKWTYKIVNPSYLGQGNAGDSGSAWVWIGDERGKQP